MRLLDFRAQCKGYTVISWHLPIEDGSFLYLFRFYKFFSFINQKEQNKNWTIDFKHPTRLLGSTDMAWRQDSNFSKNRIWTRRDRPIVKCIILDVEIPRRNQHDRLTLSGLTLSMVEWAPNVLRVATLRHGYNMIEETQSFERAQPKGYNSSIWLQNGWRITTLRKDMTWNSWHDYAMVEETQL